MPKAQQETPPSLHLLPFTPLPLSSIGGPKTTSEIGHNLAENELIRGVDHGCYVPVEPF